MSQQQIDIFKQSLQNHIDMIDQASAKLQQGQITNIKPMEAKIETLCMNIIAAGRETGMALEPKMKEMISKLDQFEAALSFHKEQLLSRP